jgi:hypothetical protein
MRKFAHGKSMKNFALLLSLALFPVPALAATAQQEKMKACNARAKGLKGDEYRKVRDECLKGRPVEAADAEAGQLTPQQEKMKSCNARAKGLKGDEYRNVRDECLKGQPAGADAKQLTPQQEKMKACNARANGLEGDEYRKVRNECLKAK